MSSAIHFPETVRVREETSLSHQSFKENPSLSKLKDEILKPWESKILSKGKVVSLLAFGFIPLILVVKIHDYALRNTRLQSDQNLKKIEGEKKKLLSSIAKTWVKGRRFYAFDSLSDKSQENFLQKARFTVLDDEGNALKKQAESFEWINSNITRSHIGKGQVLFLSDNQKELQKASPQVQTVHAYLTQLLENQLVKETLLPIYDQVTETFNHDPIKTLEFFSLLTEEATHLDLERSKIHWKKKENGTQSSSDRSFSTQVQVELKGNRPKITVEQTISS